MYKGHMHVHAHNRRQEPNIEYQLFWILYVASCICYAALPCLFHYDYSVCVHVCTCACEHMRVCVFTHPCIHGNG